MNVVGYVTQKYRINERVVLEGMLKEIVMLC